MSGGPVQFADEPVGAVSTMDAAFEGLSWGDFVRILSVAPFTISTDGVPGFFWAPCGSEQEIP